MGKGKNRTGEHKIGCYYLVRFIVSAMDKRNSDGGTSSLAKEMNPNA
jgi:hypothetical protein